jgi:hypothetical protein
VFGVCVDKIGRWKVPQRVVFLPAGVGGWYFVLGTQTMVSMALRGTNQKTFLRLLALLKNDYNLDFSESLSSENDLETIKTELQNLQSKMGEVLKGIDELKGMLKK